jgi:D-alanyl-lipoteichoic acid acyltransferase DltB (MBOAT superfamily)
VRASQFLPQLRLPASLSREQFESGLSLIFWGLTKKVVIADFLGRELVDMHYAQPELYGGWYALLAMYAYAFQIYGDFSGYSDVAIGAGRLLGFELPLNFDSPYKSTSWREFWRRWHITFSTWFRDYLFVPLGGSRGSPIRIARSLFVTMALVGLWHGAGWTFLVFGMIHGLLIGTEIVLGVGKPRSRAASLARWALTFHGCVFTMILFRAPDMGTAWAVLSSLADPTPSWPISPLVFLAVGFAAVTHFLADDLKALARSRFLRLAPELKGFAYAGLLGLLANAATLKAPFIYFQF